MIRRTLRALAQRIIALNHGQGMTRVLLTAAAKGVEVKQRLTKQVHHYAFIIMHSNDCLRIDVRLLVAIDG